MLRSATIRSVDFFCSNLARKPPLAYVGGWLGQDNLGDEALIAAVRQLFPKHSLWHYDGSRTHSTLLRHLGRTRAGIFAGGTLINRAPEYLRIAEKFIQLGKTLRFFGTGVADPDFWTGRGDFRDMLQEWKPLLEQCGMIGVRGPRSAQLLVEAGIQNVEVTGDPVITFADLQLPHVVRPCTLGLNIGFNHGQQWGSDRDLQIQMLTLAKLARSADWQIKWFVVFPADLPITRELAKETGTEGEVFCSYTDPHRYIEEVRSMNLFAGMKLHATMLALCGNVPSLMLEYDPKCRDFMDSINQGTCVIRTDHFEARAAWETLRHWEAERDDRAKSLHSAMQHLRRKQITAAETLANYIVTLN